MELMEFTILEIGIYLSVKPFKIHITHISSIIKPHKFNEDPLEIL